MYRTRGQACSPRLRLHLVFTPITRRSATSKVPKPRTQTAQTKLYKSKPLSHVPRIPSPAISKPPEARNTNALETADAIFKARKVPLLASGVVALGLGIYLSLLAASLLSSPACQHTEPTPDVVPTGRPSVFTKESARKFDQSLDGAEWLMGITSLRKKLAAEASGHVLEVAMGTGRNLAFYDWTQVLQPQSSTPVPGTGDRTMPILSFTGVDISGEMLGVAVEKVREAVPALRDVEPSVEAPNGRGVLSYLSDRLRIFRSDINEFIPLPTHQDSGSAKYDTVVQTFGLCSVRNPDQVVRNLASMVKPNSGRIILIEHGRGWWGVVNGLLDRSAASHFQKYGCWWNRDIVDIVETAARSWPGLEVVKIERPYLTQLGTTLWIELRVTNPSAP